MVVLCNKYIINIQCNIANMFGEVKTRFDKTDPNRII